MDLLVVTPSASAPAFWFHLENLRDEFARLETIPPSLEGVYQLLDTLIEYDRSVVVPTDIVARFLGAFKYVEGYEVGAISIRPYDPSLDGLIRVVP